MPRLYMPTSVILCMNWLWLSWDQPGCAVRQKAVPGELGCLHPHRPLEMFTSHCPQLFAASPFSKNAKLVYRLVQDLCSYGSWNIVTCWDAFSLFPCLGGCQQGYGLEWFYNLMEAKKRTPALLPSLRCSQTRLFHTAVATSAACSPVGLVWEGEMFSRAVEERAVYYLLPLDTDSRVPILTAAVRLPGVQNQHLLKQLVVLYFSRKCSQQSLRLQHSWCACGALFFLVKLTPGSWENRALIKKGKRSNWKECCVHRYVVLY